MTDSKLPLLELDRTPVARWTVVALLCTLMWVVCNRGRDCGLPVERVDTAAAKEPGAELASASNPATKPLQVVVPDFLEPFPAVEATSYSEQLPPSEPLPPVPIDEPPSEPLPPPSEPISSAPDRAEPIKVADEPPAASLPTEEESVAVETHMSTEPESEVETHDDEDAELAAQLTPQDLLAFSPSVAEISQKMLPEVRSAFELMQHGATHAAHARFIDLLRRIAEAKDVEAMTERHSRSLDEGLMALDEADDFMPAGGITPNLELASIAATHETPMLKVHQSRYTLPHEAVALYHRFAQQKLGAAVAGEQAGSMALHGLGKIHARWAEIENEPLSDTRHSMTMYRAALVAHPRNHLAANELGVLLARAGRYEQAATSLEWAAQLAGTATIYRNLAVVQNNRGEKALAANARAQSERLALLERTSGEVSRRHGVQWVAPQDMARVSDSDQPTPQPAPTATAEKPVTAAPKQRSPIVPAPRGGTWR